MLMRRSALCFIEHSLLLQRQRPQLAADANAVATSIKRSSGINPRVLKVLHLAESPVDK